jgi:hypothetical protein
MKKALAVLTLAGLLISGCSFLSPIYQNCSFNIPVHASLLDLPFLKPEASPTPQKTPPATPATPKPTP